MVKGEMDIMPFEEKTPEFFREQLRIPLKLNLANGHITTEEYRESLAFISEVPDSDMPEFFKRVQAALKERRKQKSPLGGDKQ